MKDKLEVEVGIKAAKINFFRWRTHGQSTVAAWCRRIAPSLTRATLKATPLIYVCLSLSLCLYVCLSVCQYVCQCVCVCPCCLSGFRRQNSYHKYYSILVCSIVK